MKYIETPLSEEVIADLKVGDVVSISGWIYTGRDAVLPKVQQCVLDGTLAQKGIDLKGAVIFHTAVSDAGVGPTSSNKEEIEASIGPLSEAGVKLHLGKGKIGENTINELNINNSVYAVIPPTTALFEDNTLEKVLVGWPELGMEALYKLRVKDYQAIIASAQGESIY